MIKQRFVRWGLIPAVCGSAIAGGCASTAESESAVTPSGGQRRVVAVAPSEGDEFWYQPSSRDAVGEGSIITLKVDHITVPESRLMAGTQTLAASGIPVHAHAFEDELLYVVSGRGFAIVGDARQEIALEPGSLLYVPPRAWHGVRNAEPDERMKLLLVTTPSNPDGLAAFFRHASVRPGHPPLNLPEEELLALFAEYGMLLPSK